MRRRFCATMRSPACSIMALIAPVRLREVASGLMMENVRSMAMAAPRSTAGGLSGGLLGLRGRGRRGGCLLDGDQAAAGEAIDPRPWAAHVGQHDRAFAARVDPCIDRLDAAPAPPPATAGVASANAGGGPLHWPSAPMRSTDVIGRSRLGVAHSCFLASVSGFGVSVTLFRLRSAEHAPSTNAGKTTVTAPKAIRFNRRMVTRSLLGSPFPKPNCAPAA